LQYLSNGDFLVEDSASGPKTRTPEDVGPQEKIPRNLRLSGLCSKVRMTGQWPTTWIWNPITKAEVEINEIIKKPVKEDQ
jgi:hypothetical protein